MVGCSEPGVTASFLGDITNRYRAETVIFVGSCSNVMFPYTSFFYCICSISAYMVTMNNYAHCSCLPTQLEAEFRKLKDLKHKAEQYALEAKHTAQ